jgi:hypothetical protein
MRPADPANADFYLLEELSKPLASLNAGQISVWVYRDGPSIREIVLAGHAESGTCASATSIIIEAAKQLGPDAGWMMTCGAAHFRLQSGKGQMQSGKVRLPPGASPLEYDLFSLLTSPQQSIAGEMVQNLRQLGEDTGLVHVFERDFAELAAFRARFRRHLGAGPPEVVLPDAEDHSAVADYLPIVPEHSGGKPLVFTLEGWDFDCPSFQAVADVHLRNVQRELLRDALRRRRKYRGWLKEWMEEWIPRLKWLPEDQAAEVHLAMALPCDDGTAQTQQVDIPTFLEKHAGEFLDRGQSWYRPLARYYRNEAFGEAPDGVNLDEVTHPTTIREIDFERGVERERAATADDAGHTLREYFLFHRPQLVATCLRYIRRMDAIIKPYEDLRVWQRARRERPGQNATRQEREAFIVADISRCIVLETMVRGWPSFYLDDKEDGAMFEAWANEYRPRVWSLMAQQAEEVGVSLEQLLEDNVVYKVEFNDDLGCTVQPLVLADNAAHAQIHRSQAGAAAVVPLWPRHAPQPLQDAVLAMASSNTQRAECLVDKARSLVDRYTPDLPSAAACLRLALSCNPAEAGRLILAEWAKRLGRDTQEEFDRARHVVHAARLCTEDRYAEASPHVTAYLKVEPRPVGAALVMAALCELMPRGTAVPELNETPGRQRALLEHFEQIAGKSLKDCSEAELHNMAKRNPKVGMLLYDLMSLGQQAQRLSVRVAEEEAQRRALIEQALAHPSAIPVENPSLARAVAEVPDLLRATLEDHCLYVPGRFEDMHRRYVDVAQVVELRSLFEIVHRLNSILHRIERDPNQAQQQACQEMRQLASDPWMPPAAEGELKVAAEEFAKGEWDRLLSNWVRGVIREAMSTGLARIQDVMSDSPVTAAPMSQTIATRIHVTQTIEGKYQKAFEMFLSAKVALGRAIDAPWTIVNDELRDFPANGRLVFQPRSGAVTIQTPNEQIPLLKAELASEEEQRYLREILADPGLPARIRPFAMSVARGLLAAEVEPRRSWQCWRDVLALIRKELVFVMGMFSYSASLLPELAPPMTDAGKEMDRRMDRLTPRDAPRVDRTWKELGTWRVLIGTSYRRSCESQGPS